MLIFMADWKPLQNNDLAASPSPDPGIQEALASAVPALPRLAGSVYATDSEVPNWRIGHPTRGALSALPTR
jgi:hypothetical protein